MEITIITTENKTDTYDDMIDQKYFNKKYYKEFNEWKNSNKSGHVISQNFKSKELTYIQGYGIVTEKLEVAERRALKNVVSVVGFSLVFYTLMDLICTYLVPLLANYLDIPFVYDYFTRKHYGVFANIYAYEMFFTILKHLIPVLYFIFIIKMPVNVLFPTKITSRQTFNCIIPITLLVCGFCNVLSIMSTGFFSSIGISPVFERYTSDTLLQKSALVFLYSFFVQILTELFLRGPLLQIFRQFGDGAAILFTSFFSAMLCYDPTQMVYFFVTGIVAGYFAIRTGSIISAVISRVIATVYFHGLVVIERFLPTKDLAFVTAFAIISTTVIGVVFTINRLAKHKVNFGITFKQTELKFLLKIYNLLSDKTMILWMTLCLIMTMIEISTRFR